MKLYYFLMNLLVPPKCILCGRLLEKREQDLCRECRCDSPEYPFRKENIQFLDSFTAVWYYEGSVRKSLLRYKFYNSRSFADGYGRLLAMKLLQTHRLNIKMSLAEMFLTSYLMMNHWMKLSMKRKKI